ncbi:coiled-coil domain-containing protein 33 isoform X2 [Zootoca vivipara]|uniref:coiled-coil domain-containing protein 33 isoform X2 n=1 Tax=Zootoca vivipara TaxID=8524 RepID=UPI00293BD769|nr:coiled-coil domain-containing protein 33 isoform X2 [Zootoca vivipara]
MAGKAAEPRVPVTLQKSRLKAEEKVLDLDFELGSVQFNEAGRYALRLTVENPLLEGSGAGVQLRVNEGDPLYINTATTDIVDQSNLNEVYAFEKRRFLFTLPRGFCKNDKNHDARLRIEALRLRGSSLRTSVRAGEAFFAIYPRTNQPRMNLFASRDEDLYRYGDIMVLLRVGSDDLAMHCGRLAYAVSFHEHRPVAKKQAPTSPLPPPKLKERSLPAGTNSPAPPQSLPIPQQIHLASAPEPRPRPTEEACTSGLLPSLPQQEASPGAIKEFSDEQLSSSSLPSSSASSSPALPRRLPSDARLCLPSPGYSPELLFENIFSGVLVKEDPAGPGTPTSKPSALHLANPEMESIEVTLHGASNLPSNKKGNVPSPYVIVKTTSDEDSKQPAQGVTHVAAQPTHRPIWEETVAVEINQEKAEEEDISLIVADKDTKEILAKYSIPVKHLQPFHPYHCALVLPRKKDPAGTKLHVTITRKGSLIPRYPGMNYTGLEVFLKGINEPLEEPDGTVLAVGRIVNNVKAYMKEMKARPLDAHPVPEKDITFPDPPMQAFEVPRVTNQGHPQVSPAAGPPEQPTWNMSYLFQGRDGATAFSDDTALVIEYYKKNPDGDLEIPPKSLGFSVLPLSNRVYRKLVADSSRNGVRVENLPIQNTDLRTTSGEVPTVELGVQLINSERPDLFLTSSTTDGLPVLDPELVGQLGTIKEPWTSMVPRKEVNPDELPPHDAVMEILPEKRPRPIVEEVPDPEMDNYHAAMQRMADDILSLRQHVTNLESENSTLRRSLNMHEDVGRVMLHDIDPDVMTKAEIIDRILTLKQKLSAGAREMARMKDRVQRLQNELIRKNDREKDLVMLQRAHQQQQMVLRKYQAKISKMQTLEDAVKKQEKVIERMEMMLEGKMKERSKEDLPFSDASLGSVPGDNWSKGFYSTLMMENMRLRDELGKSSSYRSPIILQQQALPDTFSNSNEKLSLISKLERAEARINALECQLEDSARKWGREKQDYSTRLLERDLGLDLSPTPLLLGDTFLDEKEGRGDEELKNAKIYGAKASAPK